MSVGSLLMRVIEGVLMMREFEKTEILGSFYLAPVGISRGERLGVK